VGKQASALLDPHHPRGGYPFPAPDVPALPGLALRTAAHHRPARRGHRALVSGRDRLEPKGFVRRVRNTVDRRKILVELTEAAEH
jgi:hypothetical protein